ncbi:MAG: DNA polymerase IV [Candidatus Micrarchaeaceae archaeon]
MTILYIDMDYFYAACEELRHPDYKGKPFAVGSADEANKLKGVIQTSNYAARKYGIKSGMPAAMAFKLYPNLIYAKADEDYYEGISKKLMDILKSYGFKMQQNSIDEAALDLKEMPYEDAEKLGKEIKERIEKELMLPSTVGISFGPVFAKMACDAAKPDGLLAVDERNIMEFLKGKPIESIPGIGPRARERLEALGIKTIDELGKANVQTLKDSLGIFGEELYLLAEGVDRSKVEEDTKTLSISREKTLEKAATSFDELKDIINEMSRQVSEDAKAKGLLFKSVGIKIRYEDFTQITRNAGLSHYSSSWQEVYEIAEKLCNANLSGKGISKIGVRISSFMEGSKQKRL